MFLQLNNASAPMKLVYSLSQAMKENPKEVAMAQALTLDAAKPLLGLKGVHGLYGSEQWWDNVLQRRTPLLFVKGVIQRVYTTGMDDCEEKNTIDLLMDDGAIRTEGIYVNDKADIELFRVGCRVELVCVLDELKRQPAPDGGINYLELPLEMVISV